MLVPVSPGLDAVPAYPGRRPQLGRQVHLVLTSSPDEARLLALDLITYRWAVRASGATPDVKNIDGIIKALDGQSNGPHSTLGRKDISKFRQGCADRSATARE